MDRTPVSNSLHPAEDWLQGDDALAMLLTSVGAYTADDMGNEQTRAQNAAKVYLAFCLGLQKAGVLSIQHAPHLWIDIGETSFKICLQHDSIITSATVSEASSSLSSEFLFVDARSEGDRVDGCGSDLAVAVKSPNGQMLSFLETVKGQLSESAVLALPDEQIDQISQETLPDGSVVGNVARGLLRLDQVDMQSGKIGMRYNYAYYGLGQAYGIAIGAQDNGPQGWKVARQSLTIMMQELAAYQGLAYLNNAKGRLAWSKRLQRAHKFCLLVDIFGLIILNVYPAVSVSRLDKVSLTSLEQVKRGHIGKGLTAAIKLQLSISHS